MRHTNKVLFTLALAAVSFGAFAQDDDDDEHTVTVGVPEVFIVDIEPAASKNITVGPEMASPAEAGEALDFTNATDNTLWLNYSSIVENSGVTRDITVAVTAGTIPTGITVTVEADVDAGTGDGTMGSVSGAALTLSGSAQNIVTGIGSCYTGDGASNGHNLTYTVALTSGAGNYAQLFTDNNATLTVTYTITD